MYFTETFFRKAGTDYMLKDSMCVCVGGGGGGRREGGGGWGGGGS